MSADNREFTLLTLGTKIEYAFHQTLFLCAIKRLDTRWGGGGGGGGGRVSHL